MGSLPETAVTDKSGATDHRACVLVYDGSPLISEGGTMRSALLVLSILAGPSGYSMVVQTRYLVARCALICSAVA